MKYPIVLFLLFCSTALFPQTATYKLVNKTNGSYCNIAVRQTADLVEANILASWNTKDGKYGEFTGKGIIANNKCILKADSSSCTASLSFATNRLNVEFADCMDNLIPEDFSGSYSKIADNIRGEYIVISGLSYFYSKPEDQSRKKGFANKGQILNIEELFPGDWGFATMLINGRQSFGYVKLSDLKFRKTYLYD